MNRIESTGSKIALCIVCIIIAIQLTGCSVCNRDNRRCLNFLDEKIHFDSTYAKIGAGFIFVPVGTVVLACDAAIVNPAFASADAAKKSYETIWAEPFENKYINTIMFIPKTAATPVVFTAEFVLEGLIDG